MPQTQRIAVNLYTAVGAAATTQTMGLVVTTCPVETTAIVPAIAVEGTVRRVIFADRDDGARDTCKRSGMLGG